MSLLDEDKIIDLENLKVKLLAQRDEIGRLDASSAASARPVELDQSRVGRLSRMDAMQAQAMSLEVRRRREIQLSRIENALKRIESDEFGDCIRCGEPNDKKRIEFDPAMLLCIECAKEREA